MHLSSWINKPVEIPFDEDLYYDELMTRVKTSRRKENVHELTADTTNSYNTKSAFLKTAGRNALPAVFLSSAFFKKQSFDLSAPIAPPPHTMG